MSSTIRLKKEMEEAIEHLLREKMRSAGIPETTLEDTLNNLMNSAITVLPPEEQRPQFVEMIVMNSSARGGGQSIKPGNIKLNLRLLLEATAGGLLTLESIDSWWTLPFGLLVVWSAFTRTQHIQLTESDAVTILAMWQASINNGFIATLTDIQTNASLHATKYRRAPLSAADIQHSIDNLIAIGSVKPLKNVTHAWKVQEELSLSYR